MDGSKDLSYLLQDPAYSQNVDFVLGCYKDLLNSSPDIDGLYMLCRQLQSFYTRKSLIVAISDSQEFAGRYEIKNLQQYRKEAYLPRALRYMIREYKKKLGLNEIGGSLGPKKRISFSYPTYSVNDHYPDLLCEFNMLSGCRIDNLKAVIRKLISERYNSAECIGSMASELSEESSNHSDTAVLTSVKDIVSLINEPIPKKLKKYRTLLITIPQPINVQERNGIDIIWDKNWRDVTGKGKDSHRWLLSGNDGETLLINRQNHPVMVSLEFNLYCFYDHSVVRISQGDQSKVVPVRRMIRKVKLKTILTPGMNPISFQYIASFKGEEKDTAASIGIGNLKINGCYADMGRDMRHLGTGYYEAVFTDDRIRSVLHKNGYAEIECIRVDKDSTVVREKTTRFLEYGPNSIARCYYTLDPGDNDEEATGNMIMGTSKQNKMIGTTNSQSSVRLYIVKKAASMTPLNNPIVFT